MNDPFLVRATQEPLVLDGAMATYIGTRRSAVSTVTACDDLSLTRPSAPRRVHAEYLSAGADVVRTNTFSAAGRDPEQAATLCAAAVRLARQVTSHPSHGSAARRRFVVGALGPGGERSSAVRRRDAYRAPIRAFLDAGVDAVLFETWCWPASAAAALAAFADAAADAGNPVPVLLSMALAPSGRLAVSGAPIDDLLEVAAAAGVTGLGVNCGATLEGLGAALVTLRRHAPIVTCHPSAGLPDKSGRYPLDPDAFARRIAPFAAAGLANVVGGCCGTTPAHIAALARAVAQ